MRTIMENSNEKLLGVLETLKFDKKFLVVSGSLENTEIVIEIYGKE